VQEVRALDRVVEQASVHQLPAPCHNDSFTPGTSPSFTGSLGRFLNNRELLKIGEDAHRELGTPGMTAELEGRADRVADVDGRLFGLDEETAHAPAHTKTVVRRLRAAAHLDRVLVDYFFVGLGIAFAVVHVPTQGGEEGVQKLLAELGFVGAGRTVRRPVAGEPLDEGDDLRRWGHVGASGDG